jgi:hypothetical protein
MLVFSGYAMNGSKEKCHADGSAASSLVSPSGAWLRFRTPDLRH